MSIYRYEQAFEAVDKTSRAMRNAISKWYELYYGTRETGSDPCQRIAWSVVSRLIRTIFGEYRAESGDVHTKAVIRELDKHRKEAMQQMLVGGESYLKPWLEGDRFRFMVIPRNNILIFARDPEGVPTDVGIVERSTYDKHYYTLLERRRVDGQGCLCIENTLYRSFASDNLGTRVPLSTHPDYKLLAQQYRYDAPLGGVGLVMLRNPALNCVDGSADGVSIYAPAAELIRNIDRNEALFSGEFERGRSRLVVSADMLTDPDDDLFVGLDEDPDRVGMTIFSPQLREQSYLARKQAYLRDVESIIGLRRGMLSDANEWERTATEITSSAGDYNLTVIEMQTVWERALQQSLKLCAGLAGVFGLPAPDQQISVDWGNGVLYDEAQTWQEYRQMVLDGLLRPEVALGWRFGMPADTEADRLLIRQKLMPGAVT